MSVEQALYRVQHIEKKLEHAKSLYHALCNDGEPNRVPSLKELQEHLMEQLDFAKSEAKQTILDSKLNQWYEEEKAKLEVK